MYFYAFPFYLSGCAFFGREGGVSNIDGKMGMFLLNKLKIKKIIELDVLIFRKENVILLI